MIESLSTGIFPGKLKVAKVIPIFKKDDPLLIENYRPISILIQFLNFLKKLYVTNSTITSMWISYSIAVNTASESNIRPNWLLWN